MSTSREMQSMDQPMTDVTTQAPAPLPFVQSGGCVGHSINVASRLQRLLSFLAYASCTGNAGASSGRADKLCKQVRRSPSSRAEGALATDSISASVASTSFACAS